MRFSPRFIGGCVRLVVVMALLGCQDPTRAESVMSVDEAIDGPTLAVQRSLQRDVFMQTQLDVCLHVTGEGQPAMTQAVTLQRKSNLLLYFTFEWGSLDVDEEGLLSPALDGSSSPFPDSGLRATWS